MSDQLLKPVYEITKKFLSAFGGVNQVETFQTFPDPKKAEDQVKLNVKSLTKVLHRSFDSVKAYLATLNNQFAGIFFTVNQTDLLGRTKKNIVRIRALFCDVDDGTERVFPIEPSLAVKTRNGYHYYFIVKGNFPIDCFEPMMKAIIKRHNTDPKVFDVSRVMRLPGFYHMKYPADPFLITLQNFNPNLCYTFDELMEAFPFDIEEAKEGPRKSGKIINVTRKKMKVDFEINERAYLKNIINGGCPALKRSWNQDSTPHNERVALMSFAIRTKDGEKLLHDRWPSEITNYQIDNAKKNNLLPWSCRLLQNEGICKKGDPLFGDKCFKEKNGHEPSPIRLAYGVARAFKNITREVESA